MSVPASCQTITLPPGRIAAWIATAAPFITADQAPTREDGAGTAIRVGSVSTASADRPPQPVPVVTTDEAVPTRNCRRPTLRRPLIMAAFPAQCAVRACKGSAAVEGGTSCHGPGWVMAGRPAL